MTNDDKKHQEQQFSTYDYIKNIMTSKLWICLSLLVVVIFAMILHFITPSVDSESINSNSAFLNEQLENYQEYVLESEFTNTSRAIEQQIDEAFEPVYQGIENVVDEHYTIKGQYAELLTDYVEAEIEEKMLSGLDGRLESADSTIKSVYQEEIKEITRTFVNENNPGLFTEKRKLFNEMFDTVANDAKERFNTPEIITARLASVGTGFIARTYISRRIATAAKNVSRRAAGKGATAAGAAAGSFLGPVGTVAGAIGGSVVGWVASDLVIIKLDEHLNREKFEAELKAEVDERKQAIKNEMQQQLIEANESIKQCTPKELLKRS